MFTESPIYDCLTSRNENNLFLSCFFYQGFDQHKKKSKFSKFIRIIFFYTFIPPWEYVSSMEFYFKFAKDIM